MARLKIFVSAGASNVADCLTNLVEQSSYQVELEFFRDLIVYKISATDVLNKYIE